MIHQRDVLTVPETADLLRLKVSTVRAWILKNRLPYLKLGRRVFIRRVDIDALLVASLVPAAGRQ